MTETYLFLPANPNDSQVMEMAPHCVELSADLVWSHDIGSVDLAPGSQVTLARELPPFCLVWSEERRLLKIRAADLEPEL